MCVVERERERTFLYFNVWHLRTILNAENSGSKLCNSQSVHVDSVFSKWNFDVFSFSFLLPLLELMCVVVTRLLCDEI